MAMFHLPDAQSHFVECGRVWCPLQGDIDVERCLGCRWLKSAELTGPKPRVNCGVQRPSLLRRPEETVLLLR